MFWIGLLRILHKKPYKPSQITNNMPKIKVDKEKCIGCGACVSSCPKTFTMVDGKAHVKTPEVKKITCEAEAVDICPVSAITIIK